VLLFESCMRHHRLRDYDPPMDIWLRRSSSFQDESDADAEFWQRMTPDERVAVLEQMRREWLEEHDRGDQGLRRIARRIPAP